jgi:hypothetical protein
MRRLLLIVLVLSVGHASTAFAAGPLMASAIRTAERLAQPTDTPAAVESSRLAATYRPVVTVNAEDTMRRIDRGPAARAAQNAPPAGGPKVGTAAKTAIWVAVVVVGTAWAYKTFSETRGTR